MERTSVSIQRVMKSNWLIWECLIFELGNKSELKLGNLVANQYFNNNNNSVTTAEALFSLRALLVQCRFTLIGEWPLSLGRSRVTYL